MNFGGKYKSLAKHTGRFDILEGTTFSGKTTFGFGVKFMLEVARSDKKFHGLAAKDFGTAEKNIVNAEYGILAEWGDYVKYEPNGRGNIRFPHIVFYQDDGSFKIIYVFGYDDKKRWEKILGGQLGCLGVDEANIANIDYIQEASIRQDYMIWTLNPDNPELEIYERYINHSRPLDKYINDYPPELLNMLNKEHKPEYTHWYFTFDDNVGCTPEKRQQIISNTPIGTKLYINKILGLRGVGGGALYANYMSSDIIVDYDNINMDALEELICSVDMGTSNGESDTKHAHTIATITGFSKKYRRIIVLESKYIPSNDLDSVIDEVDNLIIPYWANFYTRFTKIVIDYGDSGGLLVRSWKKRSRLKSITVKPCVKTGKIGNNSKEINLQSRAQLKCQLLAGNFILWTNRSIESYKAHMNILSTDDGKELDSGTIYNDYADSLTYSLTERWIYVNNIISV